MSQRLVLRGLFDGFQPNGLGEFAPLWPGVEILPLYGMSPSGKPLAPTQPSAGFIRYAPGASVPTHRHPGYEHIIVLSGAQSDDRGVYERGTCVMSPPGTSHGVASERGCLVLAIWNQSVEVIGG